MSMAKPMRPGPVRGLMAVLAALVLASAAPAAAQVNVNELLGGGGDAGVGGSTTAGGGTGVVAPSGDTASRFQQVAKAYEQAVGLVVVVVPDGQGGFRSVPFGTAWAFAPTLLGTNAHIAQPTAQLMERGHQVFVLPNGSRGESHRVVRAVSHPRYGDPRPNAMGVKPFPNSYDIGVLEVEEPFPATVKLARPEQIRAVDSGTPVAFLGFPTERLINSNVNVQNPIATMQTGIVTSISDFFFEDKGPDRNLLIRHNLPATGGASGSPLFLSDGSVVGALNAGNINMVELTTQEGTDRYRVPSAAQVNFGMRIDILNDLVRRE
jgi:hypothetical protein